MKVFLQGLLAGVAMFIVSFIFSFLTQVVMPNIQKEYISPVFRPWSDPLMSLYYVYPFVLGIILSFVWSKTRKLLNGKSFWKRGFLFGILYWIAASIPGMFITYSSFNVSFTMVLTWSIGGLLEALTAGAILAWINR